MRPHSPHSTSTEFPPRGAFLEAAARPTGYGERSRWWWQSIKAPKEVDRVRVFLAWMFGVVAPEVVLYLDTRVADPTGGVIRFLPMRPYSALLIHGWVAMLATWLLLRRGPPAVHRFLALPLAAGAVFALFIGMLLAPLGIVALTMTPVGVLGLVPVATGVVFHGMAAVAWKAARHRWERERVMLAGGLALGALLGGTWLAGRLCLHMSTWSQAVLLGTSEGDPRLAETTLHLLRRFPGITLGGGPLSQAARRETGDGEPLRPDLREILERIEGSTWEE